LKQRVVESNWWRVINCVSSLPENSRRMEMIKEVELKVVLREGHLPALAIGDRAIFLSEEKVAREYTLAELRGQPPILNGFVEPLREVATNPEAWAQRLLAFARSLCAEDVRVFPYILGPIVDALMGTVSTAFAYPGAPQGSTSFDLGLLVEAALEGNLLLAYRRVCQLFQKYSSSPIGDDDRVLATGRYATVIVE
jgi:hypothetical protein